MSRRSLSILLLAAFAGCDFPGRPDPANKFVAPNKVADFGLLFKKNCAGCHGKDGRVGPAPPLNDPLFLAIVTEADLTKVVSDGRPGTEMPAFLSDMGGTLTKEQVAILAKGLIETWGKPAPANKDWPPYTATGKGDPARGKTIFATACANCHGPDGMGIDKSMGPINDGPFLALASEQFLRRIVITGRSDLGMPNYLEKTGRPNDFAGLSATDVDDVVALLLSWKSK